MNARVRLIFCVLACGALSGCSREPDEIKRFDVAEIGITYLMEIHYGEGAVVADDARVYVTAKGPDAGDKRLVLSGSNLDIKSIRSVDSTNVDICYSGLTDTFVNEIQLHVDGRSVKVVNHLKEDCQQIAPPEPPRLSSPRSSSSPMP